MSRALRQREGAGARRRFHQRALQINKQVYGEDHPEIAIDLYNLGLLYQAQSRNEEAEQFHQDALRMREETLGDDHPDVALRLTQLAALYRDRGRYEEAEPLFKRLRRGEEHQLDHARDDRRRHYQHNHPQLTLRVRLEHLHLLPLIS